MINHSILLVDDQPENLQTMIKYLNETDSNYKILKAPNGKIAYDIAKRKKPSLIITDWDMPVMNGIEEIKLLRSDSNTKDIPVIVASGAMTLPENIKTAMEAGAGDYIKKPVDKIELSARVNSMLKLSTSYKKIKEQNTLLETQKNKIQKVVEELEEANKTKDKFFSIIAHDLKNPFHLMMGYSDLLIEDYDELSTAERKEYIGVIHESTQNTYKLLENLLLWAYTQKGIIKFKPEKENIYELSDETITVLSQAATEKSIELTNKVTNDIFVNIDKNMVSTIIRNLISNAIKFTPKGGKISIKAEPVTENKEFIKIIVSDTGVGIRPEVKCEIFELSGTISTKGTANETGTGLGLILCKEFTEKHGGKISVKSEIGKGSEFIFTIPLAV